MADQSQDIRNRTFELACGIARLALSQGTQRGTRCIIDQLLKSGTSVGANLEEAKAGSSRRDFVRYVEIALREARETVYWLRIFLALKLGPAGEVQPLLGEAELSAWLDDVETTFELYRSAYRVLTGTDLGTTSVAIVQAA